MLEARLPLLLGLDVDLGQQARDLALLHKGVQVQDGLVAGREDGLVLQQVQDLKLRVKVGHARHLRAQQLRQGTFSGLFKKNSPQQRPALCSSRSRICSCTSK